MDETIYKISAIISLILLFCPYLNAQEIIKLRKNQDSTDFSFVARLHTALNKDEAPRVKFHYLISFNQKNKCTDTIWKTSPNPFENDYVGIADLFYRNDSCTIVISGTIGYEIIINTKKHNKWKVSYREYLPILGKKQKITGVSLDSPNALTFKYEGFPTEVFVVESDKLNKYVEYGSEKNKKRKKVEIKSSDKLFVE
jgi:hypothetical protein